MHPAPLLGFLGALLLVARWSVKFNLPAALPADAPMELFSEARALAHARALADDIGVRVVGTAGVEAAERYVAAAARDLASRARATRPDLDVDFLTHRPTGSFRLNFLNHDIANAYTNLTNVAVRVRARTAAGKNRKETRSVLLNAHFDTTLGSPGGADCASCVGILLEQLRVLLHPGSAPPRAPIIFLLNGGEETFMQAAHGFVAHHPWAAEAGAVINVEATGTSGPDVLFRESGGWPAELYMKHAPRPVATATVRDLVRFANLPVDTDFSVFRDPTLEHGNLPGVDLASMLDGYSYHTDRDVVSRIRAGSIQAYGENVMRATEAFAAKLEKIETEGGDVARTRKGRVPTAPGQGGAFFDVFGVAGVVVGNPLGFHFAPLLVCLGDAAAGGGSQTRAYLAGSKTAVKSLFFATVIPASLSAARAVVFGRPLAWFGNPALAGILTIPPAALAGVAPYVAAASRRRDVNAREESALGAALVSASLAAVCGVKRAALGYLWVFWSLGLSCVIHASRFFRFRGGGHVSSSFATSLFLAPASALASPVAYVTFALINEKVGISGSEPWPLGLVVGDLTMGVAAGACVALAGFGAFPLARCDRKQIRRGWRAVSAAWLVFAAVATLRPTYAVATPKRLGVLHQHFEMDDFRFRGNVSSKRALDAEMLVGAFDAVPAANALAPLTRAAILRPTKREDFASMHPVTQLLGEGVALPARAAAAPPWGDRPPALEVRLMRHVAADLEKKNAGLAREAREAESLAASASPGGNGESRAGDETENSAFFEAFAAAADVKFADVKSTSNATRVSVVFRTRAPAWSCVRVRGDVTAWSLSPTLPGTPPGAAEGTKRKSDPLWARHAGNGAASRVWRFWVDVPDERAAAELEVQAWSLYPGGDSAEIRDVTDGLGPEISAIAATTFRSAPTRPNVEEHDVE